MRFLEDSHPNENLARFPHFQYYAKLVEALRGMAMAAALQVAVVPVLLTPTLTHFAAPLPSKSCGSIRCSATSRFGSPKTGAVGSDRLKEGALPGTYWSQIAECGEEVCISFNKGSETVIGTARVGENLLRVAERCGVMIPNHEFCFEGSCYQCEMEVVGGAKEVGSHASSSDDELVRSCICPVPVASSVQVNLINEEDVWGEGVI